MYIPYSFFQRPYRQHSELNQSRQVIRVTGEGAVFMEPDEAEISLGFTNEAQELQKAQTENNTVMSGIIRTLKTIGISDEYFQTIEYSIYPIYDFADGKQIFRAYKVNHIVRITIRNTGDVGKVVDTAVNNGANTISNISFSLADPTNARNQAISTAVTNAISKARAIAGTLNITLIEPPYQIIEEQNGQRAAPLTGTGMVMGMATFPAEPGMEEIRAKVTAVFAFFS